MEIKKVVFVFFIAWFFFSACERPAEKTAYVNNTELLQGYYKMKLAKKEFETRSKHLVKETDSIANELRLQVESYQMNQSKMKPLQREVEQKKLVELKQKIQLEQQAKSKALEEESDEAITTIVKEVRDKIAKYGEKHQYDYIFGSNESANILYAKKGKDITLDVLEALNTKQKE